ncbi:hypothetical protein [Streptomyces sp. R08]|uniref:Uncharacterized protein n=1 Tax=Streptomyces sp. R08 TaxID=3238624 RepID=A0AB39MSC1_9ACTN
MAGDAFIEKIGTEVEIKAGKAVAEVHFTVTGDTDVTFTGGEKATTILTDATGVVGAPPWRWATAPVPRLRRSPRARPACPETARASLGTLQMQMKRNGFRQT